jgi:hypothetical protein
MKVTIELDQDAHICLRDNIPSDSSLRSLFESPSMTELSDLGPPGPLPAAKDVVIECEMQEAEALLEIARKNCPEAIADITEGIKHCS